MRRAKTIAPAALSAAAVLFPAAAILLAPAPPARAATHDVLQMIAAEYEGKEFRLVVDLYQPEPGGNPAPSVDTRGWRHNDPNRPVFLRAGEAVDVTGVFNYGDKGVFLELARHQILKGDAPRIRVRFTADAEADKPEAQAAQIRALISKAIRPPG